MLFTIVGYSQQVSYDDILKEGLALTREQKSNLQKIDEAYLQDMEGIKDRADTGYNPPKHIQHQHAHILLRRFRDIKKVISTEQYEILRRLRFDIYEHKDWLVAFYKKNKLPTIEQAVAKRETQSSSNDKEAKQ